MFILDDHHGWWYYQTCSDRPKGFYAFQWYRPGQAWLAPWDIFVGWNSLPSKFGRLSLSLLELVVIIRRVPCLSWSPCLMPWSLTFLSSAARAKVSCPATPLPSFSSCRGSWPQRKLRAWWGPWRGPLTTWANRHLPPFLLGPSTEGYVGHHHCHAHVVLFASDFWTSIWCMPDMSWYCEMAMITEDGRPYKLG